MLRPRIIPVLLLREKSLVKTIKFNKFSYIGDPCNTVRIFNEFEVDEIVILDINKTQKRFKDPKQKNSSLHTSKKLELKKSIFTKRVKANNV